MPAISHKNSCYDKRKSSSHTHAKVKYRTICIQHPNIYFFYFVSQKMHQLWQAVVLTSTDSVYLHWNSWTPSAPSVDVLQVTGGLHSCFKAWLHIIIFCRARNTFVFQQDSAPATWARETVQLLQLDTPDFISPDLQLPNSLGLES